MKNIFKDVTKKLPPLKEYLNYKFEEKELRYARNNTNIEMPTKYHMYKELIKELFNPKDQANIDTNLYVTEIIKDLLQSISKS